MFTIVIPTSGDYLSEKFSDCFNIQIVEIDDNKQIIEVKEISVQDIHHNFADLINNYHITDIIAHQIDLESIKYILETKINLFIGVHIRTPDQLLKEYLNGTLKSNMVESELKGDIAL